MPGLYSHTTRATGTILTATIYNGDHQNHIDNAVPAQHDDYSANATQMQSTVDPGEVGSESLATTTAGELERLRFAIKEVKGTNQWYESVAGTPSLSLSGLRQAGFRNLALNGDMLLNIAQTAANNVTGLYYVDNFVSFTSSGRLTFSASTTNPVAGFPFNLLATVSISGASAAGDHYSHQQNLEGVFVRHLGFGAAGASSIVVQFKVRSSVTGTYSVAIRNSANNRSYVTPFTVNAANTWEDKTLVIPGDTTGTWLSGIGQIGINICIVMGAGSTASTAVTDTWQAGNFSGITGQTQFNAAANANTFQVTAFQVTEGVVATPFDRLPFDVSLRRSERYAQISNNYGTGSGSIDITTSFRMFAINTNDLISFAQLPVQLNTGVAPTIGIWNSGSGTLSAVRRVATGGSVNISGSTLSARAIYAVQSAGLFVAGEAYDFHYLITARM